MNMLSRNLALHRIKLLTAEVRVRKNYQNITHKAKVAAERWLDKKTSPYGDFTK